MIVSRNNPLLALLFVFCFHSISFGESFSLFSIEWLCTASDQITLAKIDASGKPEMTALLFTNGSQKLPEIERDYAYREKRYWKTGDEVILFAGKGKTLAGRVKKHPVLFYSIVLNEPKRNLQRTISKNGKFQRTKQAIMAIVEKRIALRQKEMIPKPTNPFMYSKLPIGFKKVRPPNHDLGRLSNFEGIIAPADPEFRQTAIDGLKSEYPLSRAYAVAALVNYPDEEVIGLLKKALKDPGIVVSQSNKVKKEVYQVRHAAYEVLKTLGHKVEKPVGFPEGYSYRYH